MLSCIDCSVDDDGTNGRGCVRVRVRVCVISFMQGHMSHASSSSFTDGILTLLHREHTLFSSSNQLLPLSFLSPFYPPSYNPSSTIHPLAFYESSPSIQGPLSFLMDTCVGDKTGRMNWNESIKQGALLFGGKTPCNEGVKECVRKTATSNIYKCPLAKHECIVIRPRSECIGVTMQERVDDLTCYAWHSYCICMYVTHTYLSIPSYIVMHKCEFSLWDPSSPSIGKERRLSSEELYLRRRCYQNYTSLID